MRWSHAAAFLGVERRSQKSSKRPLSLEQRRAMMLLAPETLQCMPDRLSRVPINTLQPASRTPVEVHKAWAWNFGYRMRARLRKMYSMHLAASTEEPAWGRRAWTIVCSFPSSSSVQRAVDHALASSLVAPKIA